MDTFVFEGKKYIHKRDHWTINNEIVIEALQIKLTKLFEASLTENEKAPEKIVVARYISPIKKLYKKINRSLLWIKSDIDEGYLKVLLGRDGAEYLSYDDGCTKRIAIRTKNAKLDDCKWGSDYSRISNDLDYWFTIHSVSYDNFSRYFDIPRQYLLDIIQGNRCIHAWEAKALYSFMLKYEMVQMGKWSNDEESEYDEDTISTTEDDIGEFIISSEEFQYLFGEKENELKIWRKLASLSQHKAAFQFQVPTQLWVKWEKCSQIPDSWVEHYLHTQLKQLVQDNIENRLGESLLKTGIHPLIDHVSFIWSSAVQKQSPFKYGEVLKLTDITHSKEESLKTLFPIDCEICSFVKKEKLDELLLAIPSLFDVNRLKNAVKSLYGNYIWFIGVINTKGEYKVIKEELNPPGDGIKKFSNTLMESRKNSLLLPQNSSTQESNGYYLPKDFTDDNYLSARLLGLRLGLRSQEVNLELAELGFISGQPGAWTITEKGRNYGHMRTGERDGITFEYIVWAQDVLNILFNHLSNK